jgi:hypothetical protein
MSKAGLTRGKNFEYRIVELAKKFGLSAKRITLSGSTDDKLDVEVQGLRFECKYRSRGFVELHSWLEKAVEQEGAGVVVGGGGRKPVVVMYAEDFFALLGIHKAVSDARKGN